MSDSAFTRCRARRRCAARSRASSRARSSRMRAAWDEAGFTPREVLRKMGALGLLGLMYSPELWRRRRRHDDQPRVPRGAVARRPSAASSSPCWCTPTWPARTWPTPATRRRNSAGCRAIIAGELITAVAVTEPDAGSDVAAIRTRAKRDGDDWVLNGTKMFITNGVHADLYFVAARTDPPIAKGSRGIVDVHRRRRARRVSRVGRALEEDRLARVGHRGAGVRQLPRPGRRTCSARRTPASTRS